ncbi:MAG: YihY/virulence factor BrkB family protein [Dehalococcoidia bacterium]|nr:YihY/virulence factor BrkB family protein [Dehalococcoidia bacterium]
MDIARRDLMANAKALLAELRDDDVTGLAAELAYRFFLALVPFLVFLAALGGLVARAAGIENPAQEFLNTFGDALPADAASVVRTQVTDVVDGSNGGLLSVSILGALWAASSGVGSLMKAINRAYGMPESRPFWKKTAISLALTAVGGIAILVAILATVVGQVGLERVATALGLGGPARVALDIARWPLALLVMMAAITVVYWAAPNTRLPFKWVTPGAAAFAVMWVVVTGGFALYVGTFGSYSTTYGALGGVVVLMLWFYLTSLVMLVGAEWNAMLDERCIAETLADRRREAAREREERGRPRAAAPATGVAMKAAPEFAGEAHRERRGHDGRQTATASTSSAFLALAGAIVAAVAWRKFAR